MTDDLLIKSVDDSEFVGGYTEYKVKMGQGFLDTLEAGVPLKEHIENDSRLEHGVRMLVTTKRNKRNINLTFFIYGDTKAAFSANKKRFEETLYKGLVDIKVHDGENEENDAHPDIYHLVYTGKSITYKHSYNGKYGLWTAQFIEPDPSNRTGEDNPYVRVIPEPEE